jgi:hypothetical protein
MHGPITCHISKYVSIESLSDLNESSCIFDDCKLRIAMYSDHSEY